MRRCCPICGRELAVDAVFCEGCGTKLTPWREDSLFDRGTAILDTPPMVGKPPIVPSAPSSFVQPPPPPEQQAVPAVSEPTADEPIPREKSWFRRRWPVLAGAAIIVTLVAGVLVYFSGADTQRLVERSYQTVLEPEERTVREQAPKEFWDYLDKRYELNPADVVMWYEEIGQTLEKDYGEDVRIHCDVLREREVSDRLLGEIRDSLKDRYGILKKDVDQVMRLAVDITVGGTDDEETEMMTLYAVSIRGVRYMIWENGYNWDFLQNYDPTWSNAELNYSW